MEEELRRVVPVIARLRSQTKVLLSVGYLRNPLRLKQLSDAGAVIINDVNGLRDPEMAQVAVRSGAGVIVMHMKGTPGTMQANPHYDDVVAEVRAFFEERLKDSHPPLGSRAGADRLRDPGIGFGKTEHTHALLRSLSRLAHPRIVRSSSASRANPSWADFWKTCAWKAARGPPSR